MSDLPVYDPDAGSGLAGRADTPDDPTVAGVVLAAGLGTRFGEDNKLLATDRGEPIVARAARTLLDADLPVLAVVGHEADRVAGALAGVDHGGRLALVGNPDYRAGQATSVAAGVRAACGADAVTFALGDMPRVDPASVRRLVDAYCAGAGDALAAAHGGRRGNPVLFDRRHFPALVSLSGDRGGRRILLDGDRSALVETGDRGVLRDVDTVEDLSEGGN